MEAVEAAEAVVSILVEDPVSDLEFSSRWIKSSASLAKITTVEKEMKKSKLSDSGVSDISNYELLSALNGQLGTQQQTLSSVTAAPSTLRTSSLTPNRKTGGNNNVTNSSGSWCGTSRFN